MVILAAGLLAALAGFHRAQEELDRGARGMRALALAESKLGVLHARPWEALLEEERRGESVGDPGIAVTGLRGGGRYGETRDEAGVHLLWTLEPDRPGPLRQVGSVLIHVRARYESLGGHPREIHLGALRANPRYIGFRAVRREG